MFKGYINRRWLIPFVVTLLLSSAPAAVPAIPELLMAGRVDEAVASLRGRLQGSPNDAETYGLLLRAHFWANQWDQAIEAGLKATALAPNNSEHHLYLGRAYGEKASRASWLSAVSLAKKCRAEFERAVELNGNSVDARADLAEFYASAPSIIGGGKDKARAQADALEKIGQLGKAHWVRASLAESDKDFALAEQEHRAAVQTAPNSADSWTALAAFLGRRQRFDEMDAALRQAQQVAERARYPGAMLDCAQLLLKNEHNLDTAAALLRGYISGPLHNESAPVFKAHYLLGRVLEKKGDRQGAATAYKSALALASGYEPARSALDKLR